MMFCFLCVFLLQFGLFWSFFQTHLVYFREAKVATLSLWLHVCPAADVVYRCIFSILHNVK